MLILRLQIKKGKSYNLKSLIRLGFIDVRSLFRLDFPEEMQRGSLD
jgi:hypothetical protein